MALTERKDVIVGGVTKPFIPYDSFEAACLFLATGRTRSEVLPLLGLSDQEWDALHKAYRWLPSHLGEFEKKRYFGNLSEREICEQLFPPRWQFQAGDEPSLRSTANIRSAVHQNPYIGPFANRTWPVTFIASHPVAPLLCYSHDGETVYFDGVPLSGRKGELIAVDAETFRVLGGRWLADKNRIYGQGESGSRPNYHWYVVEGADPDSFEPLNLRYARDANCAYYITDKIIRTKSPDAFEIVPELHLNYRDATQREKHDTSVIARDREAVYYYGARLKNADPTDFRTLGHEYATDGDRVWFLANKKVIEGADAVTFTVPGPHGPHIPGPRGGIAVTDRSRPYVDGEPCEPRECFKAWTPFFKKRPNLQGWWWHELR